MSDVGGVGAIAFVCAMPMEAKPIIAKLHLEPATRKGVKLHAGRLGPHDVVAVVTGMGTTLAGTGIDALLDAVPVQRVVVVGITGGVENDTPVGTVVCPERVVNSNTGASFRHTPLEARATVAGTMWTTDVILSGEAVLGGLHNQGVICLDMETAAIAEVCEERSVPWSVVRVISDRPDDQVDEEVFRLSNQDGTPNPRAIARYVARHPGAIPGMARMGRNVKQATELAADTAIAQVRSIG